MKDVLSVKMLGVPVITLNNQLITLPYRQSEAMLYYLLVNQSANQITLADMIWGDQASQEKMNSNIRNAFYILRKTLGEKIIAKSQGKQIRLDESFEIISDVSQFLATPESLSLYTGNFLEGFYLKNNTLFNEWVQQTRQSLKNLYMQQLHKSILDSFQSGNFEYCEELCHRQMQLNEFDEISYSYLMQIYLSRGNYHLALNIYNQLEELYQQELFDSPSKEIQALAADIEETLQKEIQQVIKDKKPLKKSDTFLLFGRDVALNQLHQILHQSKINQSCAGILISGEAGVGKTTLAEHFIGDQEAFTDYILLKTRCYHAEEKYILKPWHSLASQLFDWVSNHPTKEGSFLAQAIQKLFPFLNEENNDISTHDYKSIQRTFVNTILSFARHHSILIFLDDVQWADPVSLSLIRDIITTQLNFKQHNILFLMTARDDASHEINQLWKDLTALSQLETIHLERFGFEDTIALAARLMPEHRFSDSEQRTFYAETEGNPFFIVETIHNIRYHGTLDEITPKMKNIIQQRISQVSGEYKTLLDLISIFFDGVSFHCLTVISRKETYQLAELLEYLMDQNLLVEQVTSEDTYFTISHQKIQEYVYHQMSWTKRRLLHNKAGLYYEDHYLENSIVMEQFPRIIYHFDKAANNQKYLKYLIKYLYYHLNITHEFFPMIETFPNIETGISQTIASLPGLVIPPAWKDFSILWMKKSRNCRSKFYLVRRLTLMKLRCCRIIFIWQVDILYALATTKKD